jgi:putative protease
MRGTECWAGPFCNVTNPLTIETLRVLGFQGVFVSPELSRPDCLALAAESTLALGIVIRGFWPVSISRVLAPNAEIGRPFISPKGEEFWVKQRQAGYWVFPNWEIDLSRSRLELEKAGFEIFASLEEHLPKTVNVKQSPGLWNWDIELK